MKKNWFVFFLIFFSISCTNNNNKIRQGNTIDPGIKKQIINIAINYVRDKLNNSKKSVEEGGIINLVSDQIKYIIDPAKIVVGLIDEDTNEDAIVSISSYNGEYFISTELLVLIKTKNKYNLTKVIEGDMKVLTIKDREIFVEIPKLAPDSPNYNCAICREVVKYKYINGDLTRTE